MQWLSMLTRLVEVFRAEATRPRASSKRSGPVSIALLRRMAADEVTAFSMLQASDFNFILVW
jgi:hypothetical protein